MKKGKPSGVINPNPVDKQVTFYQRYAKIILIFALALIMCVSGVLIASLNTKHNGDTIAYNKTLHNYESGIYQTVQTISHLGVSMDVNPTEIIDEIQNIADVEWQSLTDEYNEIVSNSEENYQIGNESLRKIFIELVELYNYIELTGNNIESFRQTRASVFIYQDKIYST